MLVRFFYWQSLDMILMYNIFALNFCLALMSIIRTVLSEVLAIIRSISFDDVSLQIMAIWG
jgi:hypothetical protein